MIGSKLGHYQITGRLGSGGMGDVYEALDTKLGRNVAIKFLTEAFIHDDERVARFQREARVLASLNHPNIATIYDLEESAGRNLLVMELVPGETLADRIARGPVPVDEALRIAIQIAEALGAAHDKGITHRDLKPANIKLTDSGVVKVLDFGLAKVTESVPSASANESPTLAIGATQVGVILGTAGYMSPEQARGKSVDKRADVWAFGVVLVELLTGRRLFSGEDISETLAKVIRDEPNLDAVPAEVRPLLRRCLEKDVRNRQRDIGDVRIELEHTLAARSSSRMMAARQETKEAWSWRRVVTFALVLLVGVAVGIGLWYGAGFGTSVSHASSVMRLSISIPSTMRVQQAEFAGNGNTVLVLGYSRKPDSAEEARGRIYTRRLDDYDFKSIPGTEGTQYFVLDPSGEWLAFIATISEQSSQRRLMKVRVDAGSPPVSIANWEDGWGEPVWLNDGDLLVGSDFGTKFFRLPSNGSPAKPPIKIDVGDAKGFARLGDPLPGDRGVFVTMQSYGSRGYQEDEWLLDVKTGKAQRLFEYAGNAKYSPTGHIVFTRGESLMAAPFDLDTRAVGEVVPILGGVRTQATWANGNFHISTGGNLMYAPGGVVGTDRRLVVVDSTGNITPFGGDRRAFDLTPRVSMDGRKVAVILASAKGSQWETWVAERDRPGLRRVVALPNADANDPIWSPDGQRLVFARVGRDKDDGIYVQNINGEGAPQPFLKPESQEIILDPSSWAPGGSGLLITKVVGGKGKLLFVPLQANGAPGTPRELHASTAAEGAARFSPNGKLVAFVSDDAGKFDVYVGAYGSDGKLGPLLPVPRQSAGPWTLGNAGLAWASDSRRLFFYGGTDKVMSVTIETTPALSASAPVVAYDLKKLRVNPVQWDILPDGHLLAIQRAEGDDDITGLNIVVNWFTEFRQRMERATGVKR